MHIIDLLLHQSLCAFSPHRFLCIRVYLDQVLPPVVVVSYIECAVITLNVL